MVSQRTLALLRARLNKSLTETCTIERNETGIGATGAPMNTYELVADGVSCRVIRAGSRNSGMVDRAGGRESLVDEVRLILPYDTDVAADHRVTVGNKVYEVVAVMDDMTDSTFVSCIVKRVRSKDG